MRQSGATALSSALYCPSGATRHDTRAAVGRGGDRRCPRLRARARLTGALPHDHLCDLLRDRPAAELGVRSPAAPVADIHPDRQLHLLRLVERAVRAAARGSVVVEPGDGAGDRPHHHRAGTQDRPCGRGRGRPGRARLLQVHRLLPVVGPGRARPRRRCLQLAAAGDHPAGRDLVLYLPGAHLRGGHLSPPDAPGGVAGRARLHLLLPPPGGRPDRARVGVHAPDRAPARPAPDPGRAGPTS